MVVATGPFQTPFVPPIAEGLGPEVVQIHSTGYRSPGGHPRRAGARGRWRQHRLPDRRGAVGVARGAPVDRIAADAAASAHPGPRPVLVPRQDGADPQDDDVADRPADAKDGHPDRLQSRALRGGTASSFTAGAVDAEGSTVTFSDGTKLDVRAVIWATGFRSDHSWIDVPVFDEQRPRRAPARRHGVARPLLPRPAPGSTPEARRCSAGSRTTPSTSRNRSIAASDRGRQRTRRASDLDVDSRRANEQHSRSLPD